MTEAPVTRLMLITPELAETEAFLPALESALAAGDIAAVVIRLQETDGRTMLARAKPLVGAVQAAGAAALLSGEGAADILGRSGADGIHVGSAAEAAEAIERFSPEKIVGCGPLASRDEAMEAGERGVDYVMFGHETGSFDATIERVSWWVPIFQTPCVGVAPALGDVAALAREDVEFAALGEAVWRSPEGAAPAVAEASSMLSLAAAPQP